MFEGFTPTPRQREVPKKPQAGPYAEIAQWWPLLNEAAQQAYQQEQAEIRAAFEDSMHTHPDPAGAQVQAITPRLYDWLGVETQGRRPSAEEVLEVGEKYLAEWRFTAGYTPRTEEGVQFVRDALGISVRARLR